MPISSTSRNPRVVMSAVRAPRRSTIALVTIVVLCTAWSTSADVAPTISRISRHPVTTALAGRSASVSTLWNAAGVPDSWSNSTKSVKVPPTSTLIAYRLLTETGPPPCTWRPRRPARHDTASRRPASGYRPAPRGDCPPWPVRTVEHLGGYGPRPGAVARWSEERSTLVTARLGHFLGAAGYIAAALYAYFVIGFPDGYRVSQFSMQIQLFVLAFVL